MQILIIDNGHDFATIQSIMISFPLLAGTTINYHYNYFLELCALIFLVAMTVAYFSRKKFPIAVFKLFGVCLLTIIANISFEILTCVAMDHSDVVPLWVCEALVNIFYFSQVFSSYLLFAYVFYSVGRTLRDNPLYILTILPSAIASGIIFTNWFHHWIFSFEADAGFYNIVHGPAFYLIYIIGGLNIACSIAYTVGLRKMLNKQLLFVLLSITTLVVSSTIIQAFQPRYLITGVSYTLSLMFALISVNDPDVKVDRVSKAFNNDAFISYINTQRFEKQRKYYIVFDIENFGMFNEAFGPVCSDTLISMVRKYIESVNKKTYIFKTQSSRFVLLLRNRDEMNVMVQALKERFAKPFHINDKTVNITVNLFYFKNEETFKNSDSYNDFINRALTTINFKDENYVYVHKAVMQRINRDRRIKEILENCLANNTGLYMVYQPIYDVNQKTFNHFEALIRLDNNELGYVGPSEFIPIAESFGLANEIDFFVLHETCAFLQRNPQIETLEINISCAEFFNNPSERFLKVFNQYDIDPRRICLEITETVAVKYPEKTREFMKDLGQYGIKFAMDDFGSGYSNIARFITLPFSIAKLDKSLLEDTNSVKIFFDAAVGIFKNLNIPIVIEGVETEDQLSLSKDKKIEFIQGFYFSKPLNENDLLKFLAK